MSSATKRTELFTADEVAVRLGVSRCWLYELARAGTIGCHRLGKLVRFSEDQIETYLRNCRVDVRGYRFVKGGRRW